MNSVKHLIRSFGMTYYDAPGEADELCAMLVINKIVWACLSEDMDMFVYGCTRVIRYFSLMNHTGILYYTKGILEELELTQNEFRQICILSGTDYNIEYHKNMNIFSLMKYYQKYKKTEKGNIDKIEKEKKDITESFYQWLKETTDININIDLLNKINNMFDVKKQKHLEEYKKISITNSIINYNGLENILREDGFIFV